MNRLFWFIVDDGEFLVRGEVRRLLHDRHMVGQFGLPPQAAIGGVLGFLELGD